MKKLSFWVLSLMAVTMLTACIKDDDDPVNKYMATVDINSRTLNGDAVVFSQNTGTITINSTDMTITISSGYKDAEGVGHTFTSQAMPLTPMGGSIYSFTDTSHAVDFTGFIDEATITVWYTFFANPTDQVISTTQLIYSYNTTTVTNPDNGNNYSHSDSQYMFALDSKGEKCAMVVTNFAPNLTGTAISSQTRWDGLKVTPTTTGYIVTAEMVESNLKDNDNISDVHFVLDNQCRTINGSFKCRDLNIKVSGDMFPVMQ